MKNKANIKSNFIRHEALIVKGRLTELEGWLDAGRECLASFGGNASAYARASQTESHSTATIRQYVGVALKAMKKWGKSTNAVREAFEFGVGYAYTNMDDLRRHLNGAPKPSKPKKKSATVKVSRRQARSKMEKAGVPDKYIDLALDAIYG